MFEVAENVNAIKDQVKPSLPIASLSSSLGAGLAWRGLLMTQAARHGAPNSAPYTQSAGPTRSHTDPRIYVLFSRSLRLSVGPLGGWGLV